MYLKVCFYISIVAMQVVLGILLARPQDEQIMGHAQCKMQEKYGKISVNCSYQNLSYIPNINDSVKILIFGFNDLTNVTAETFRNISSPKTLVGLELDNNKIRNVSSNALDVFKNLEFLYLSYNPIYYDDLKYLLGALSSFKVLHEIRLGGISTIKMTKDLFSLMGGNHIRNLDTEYSNMVTVSFDTFNIFTKLETFFLSHNTINELILSKFKFMRSLYVGSNALERMPDFSNNGNESECYLPLLETLDVKYNRISQLTKDSFKCLRNLKTLGIAGNSMKTIPNDLFSKLPTLLSVNMKYLKGRNLHIEKFALRSKSLKVLMLGFNADAYAVFDSPEHNFKYLPRLKELSMSHIIMLRLTGETLSQLFSPLTRLTRFECYSCQIKQDPKYILKTMERVQNIRFLGNLITTISEQTFIYNKHVARLSLRYNQLGHIHESALPLSFLNNLSHLDLSQNPFVCDCDLEWLISWMKTEHGKKAIARFPSEYICSKPTDRHNIELANVSFTYRECHPWNPGIWAAVIGSPCAFVLCILIIVLYRNRWNIKHYIFLLRKRRQYENVQGNDKLYNAFVAYESSDSEWVRRRLLPALEDEEGLRLCVHERDFKAGVFINDNIVQNMDASENIIVVLTNSFAQSGWCMFELKVAHSKLIENESEMVIILLEKIYAKNMNQSLKVLFDTTTYIEWTEDAIGQALFWEKLKNALKKVKNQKV